MESFSDSSSVLRVVAACHIGAYSLLIIFLQFRVQSHHSFSVTTFRVVHFQSGVQSHHVFLVTMFRIVFLSLTFLDISLVWRSETLLPLGIHSYYVQFGVQSHYLHSLVFRAMVLAQHSQPSYLFFSVWRSESHFISALRAIFFSLTFRVVIPFQLSEPLSVSSSEFVAIILFFSVWHSEPYLHFGIQSHIVVLAFRAIVCLYFDIQSHFWFGVQSRCSSSIWRSEPHFHFDIKSHRIFSLAFRFVVHFSLAFRAAFFVWRSELYLHLGVQSHRLSLTQAFRAFVPFWFNVQSLIFILAFRAIVGLQFGISNHYVFLPFGVQSHIFNLAFRAASTI